MSKAGRKLAAVIIWAGIGVLIGMQLGGMEASPISEGRVSGQIEQHQGAENGVQPSIPAEDVSSQTLLQEEPEPPKFEPLPRDILLPDGHKPPADVLADKTAGLLQQLSNKSIRWVVSIFGSITD